ncbi:MAG: ABC transporter substrate-binding protein [Armatimonadia bacterium]|nr:ABC transporter substrate-binding protein [Armatimonadia bacterium]
MEDDPDMTRHENGALLFAIVALMVVAMLTLLPGCPPPEGADTDTPMIDPAAPDNGDVAAGPEGEPIKIGGLFATTGPASSLGEPEADTAKMLAKHINENGGIDGRPVEMIIRDTKGQETETLTATKELIDKENVVAIIGPSRSGSTMAIVEEVEGAEVPLVSCAAARAISDPVKKWVFQVPPGDRDAVYRIYKYMNANDISKIAICTASSGYGAEGHKQLTEQAPGAGSRSWPRSRSTTATTTCPRSSLASRAPTRRQWSAGAWVRRRRCLPGTCISSACRSRCSRAPAWPTRSSSRPRARPPTV